MSADAWSLVVCESIPDSSSRPVVITAVPRIGNIL